ncbi:MAG: radical SAM protein [Deltaproteobacteria bacterium]|nr:radical SAM protein [Deltaproteobacteria bacterium]
MGSLSLAAPQLPATIDPGPQSPPVQEWNPGKRWNPFNSHKLLAHVPRWRQIRRSRPLPPPVLVTVDPTNLCNLNCVWCNAAFIRAQRHNSLSAEALMHLADFLPRWGEGQTAWPPGVEAVCVAGGGEPLLNPATAGFIDRLNHHGIQTGLVTNGTKILDYVDPLSQCTWIGVSIDAGTAATFNDLKRLNPQSRVFENLIEHIAILVDYARSHHKRLGSVHPSYGVSYKYLLYNRNNIEEMYRAACLAKEIGCKNIHFRPAGTPWDKIGTAEEILFSRELIELYQDQIRQTLELDDGAFSVYGVTHKFNSQFGRANYFKRCHAVFMTAVIEPPADQEAPEDSFILGLCCDRRGDDKLELLNNSTDPEDINRIWGSQTHWRIHDRIRVREECPRCTYQPHNEIYEEVILNDSMTYRFI